MRNIYEIGPIDFGASDRYEYFTNLELQSYGDTLDELIDNATYSYIDQDGGDVATDIADDNQAIDYITDWYHQHKCPDIEPKREIDFMTVAKNYMEDN